MSEKTVIAWCQPIGDQIDPLAFRAYRMLQRPKGAGWHHIEVIGLPVAVARNMITAEALADPSVTHLFWVDDDMVYQPDALQRLLAHDLPFVGGLCFDRRPPFKPVIGRYMDSSWGYDPHTVGWFYDYPSQGLIDVDLTGGAFLLIKRGVFEAVRAKFGAGDPKWANWWTPLPEHQQAEDLSFCARVKACGFQINVDVEAKIGHVAAPGIVVDEPFARRNRAFEAHRYNGPLDEPVWGPIDSRRTHEDVDPIASVIIPTYNTKPEFLRAAILSALNQTVPVEVIVVDDGTTDYDPSAYVSGGAKLIHHEENRGVAAALNTGIKAMTTPWFCWLSADDLFEPHKVEAQLAALTGANALVGAHNYNLQKDNGCTVAPTSTPRWRTMEEQRDTLARWCAINGSTVMIHRQALEATRIGDGIYFDPSFKYGQDWEMWCRLGQQFFIHVQYEILGTRRDFGNLTSKIAGDADLRRAKMLEDRRISGRYSSALAPNGKLAERLLGFIEPSAKVLDIGAGMAQYHEHLLDHGCDLVLVDAHEPYLKATPHLPADRVTRVHADATSWLRERAKDPDAFDDYVIAIDFIEHLEKDAAIALIEDMKRVAFTGVVILTPDGYHPQNHDAFEMGADHLQTHRSSWSAEDLAALGFKVVQWCGFHSEVKGASGDALWAVWRRP